MFVDLRNELDNPNVRKLMSESAWDKSVEAMNKKVAALRSRHDFHIYGVVENDEILGVCGVMVHSNWVEIHNIAVDSNVRNRGIGKTMITKLQLKYKKTIMAETDDDAVRFYQKCGFKTELLEQADNTGEYQRYECVLYSK